MRSTIVKKTIGLTAGLWTLVVFGFFLKDALHLKQTVQDLAAAEARTHFNKDMAVRLWAASHGGIYVPVDENTPPNPYLAHIPERDITTPSGKLLTLMNPAYMTRHLMEHYSSLFGIKARITGLTHFRAETAPDEWETQALLSFIKGRPEIMEISEIEGEPYMRLMRPLKTEASCLKCHGEQGYAQGDIRGGVSVSIPMRHYMDMWRKEISAGVVSAVLIWLVGLVGVLLYNRQISRPLRELETTEAALRVSQENYRILVENSLTGIYVSQNDTIVFANKEFARIHGYELDDVFGMDTLRFIHPEDRPMATDRVRRRLQGLPVSDEYRVRGLTKSGGTVFVQRRNALTSFNGRPAVIGNEIDITRQMLADIELAASERQLQKLSDSLIQLREIDRGRFARDIHENVAQCLSAIKFQVESAIKNRPQSSGDTDDQLTSIVHDVQRTLTEIRALALQYSPVGLEYIGIIKSIVWLCTHFGAANPSMHIQKAFHISESDIPDILKIIIFRTVEHILHITSKLPRIGIQVGLELISDKIVFYLKSNVSVAQLNSSSPEGFLQGELAMIVLKRWIEKFGGSFMLSSSQDNETVLIATWDIYCSFPPDHGPV